MKPARVYPKFRRRGFAQIIIVAVIALAIAGIVVVAYQYFKPINYPKVAAPNDWQETSSTTPQPADETENWKTYTSTKWGFKFKYPKDWTIAKERDNGVVIIENDNGYGAPEVEFYVFEDSATKTALRNKIKSYPVNKEVHVPLDNPEGATRSYDIYKRLEDKNVDNYTALRYTLDFGYRDLGVSDQYEVSILKGTKVIEVRMIFPRLVDNKSESKVEFVDQILSTFKFTN